MNNQINLTETITKHIKKVSFYSEESFLQDANAYIKAIEENRMINVIGSVASSGMSRTLKFTSCEFDEKNKRYYQRNYFSLFKSLGYTPVKNSSYFRVSGCGMNMVFATNYDIIHNLKHIGIIDQEKCNQLCQKTPTTI